MNTIDDKSLLLSEKIPVLLIRYTVPNILAMLFLAIQSITDGIIIGHNINSKALAAINIVTPIYTIITSLSIIISVGTQAEMGINLVNKNYQSTKTTFISGFGGISFFSILATIVVGLYSYNIINMLGADQALHLFAHNYIKGLSPFFVGVALHIFFDYILKVLGHPRISFIIMLIVFISDTVLSLIFIKIFDFGVFGAGVGTGIGFTIGSIIAGYIIYKKLYSNICLNNTRNIFSLRTLYHIFYNGSSSGLSELSLGITTMLFNLVLMKHIGENGVIVFSIISYIILIYTNIVIGISDGIIPIISYNYGANFKQRIIETIHLVLKVNFILGSLFLILLLFTSKNIVNIFTTPMDKNIIALTIKGINFVSLGFLFNGINIFAASFFTAINYPKTSLLIALLHDLVFIMIGISIFPIFMGENGIWITLPLSDLLTSIIALLIIRKWLINYKDQNKAL